MRSLDDLLVPGRLVWFGEVHGTEESPRFVGDVVARALAVGHPVQLALELDPDGLAREVWDGTDGRHSHAMRALVERVRARGVPVLAYDVPCGDRDREMAATVLARRDPAAVLVGLSGNVHSRRVRGVPWDPAFVPLVVHLLEAGLDAVTFEAAARGGTCWVHTDRGIGVHTSPARDVAGEPGTLGPPDDGAHDGVYYVGVTTASLPVRDTVRPP